MYNSLSEPQLTGGLRAAQRLFRHRGCLVSCQIRVWSLLSAPYMETFPGNQLLPVSSQVATVRWKKSQREGKKERERLRERERNSDLRRILRLPTSLPLFRGCRTQVEIWCWEKFNWLTAKSSMTAPPSKFLPPTSASAQGGSWPWLWNNRGYRKIWFHEKLQSWFVIPAKLPEMMYGQILEAFAKPLGKRWPSVAALRLRGKGALHY